MKKKSLALVLALAMIVVCVVGGTLAWLTAKTGPVTNTFTYGDINITLAESKNLDLKMVPGYTITKDPKVTVATGSEECYLFVKLEKSTNFGDFLNYEMADGWQKLTGVEGVDNVYWRVVNASDKDQIFSVLMNDQVTVKNTVTKDDMNSIKTDADRPTLTVTAYASQYMKNNTDHFTEAQAWANVPTT